MNIANPMATLEDVLVFRHPAAIRRYCKDYHATFQEGEVVFQEMLKFLYLSARSANDGPEGFGCFISPEIEKLDWMWHTFLLFTRDYAAFCDRYFGFFLDHLPTDDEAESPNETALRASIEKQFSLVYDLLGEATLKAWYDECRFAALSA